MACKGINLEIVREVKLLSDCFTMHIEQTLLSALLQIEDCWGEGTNRWDEMGWNGMAWVA